MNTLRNPQPQLQLIKCNVSVESESFILIFVCGYF